MSTPLRYRPPAADAASAPSGTERQATDTLARRASIVSSPRRYVPPQPADERSGPDSAQRLARGQSELVAGQQQLAARATKLDELETRYAEAIVEVGEAAERAERVLAADAVSVGLLIAETLLGRAYDADPKALSDVVRTALRSVPEQADTRVKVSTEDLPRVELVLAGTKRASVDVVADPELGPGDCIVESPGLVVDARLRERLNAIASVLEAGMAPNAALPTHDEVSLGEGEPNASAPITLDSPASAEAGAPPVPTMEGVGSRDSTARAEAGPDAIATPDPVSAPHTEAAAGPDEISLGDEENPPC